MFAFHKPKIYRSVNGCCICKAKSSSSRFTDSKKYEPEFERCFRINERRSGEICNACVLLVKRWKKLPAGTNRDWHHVVDGREKSLNKKLKPKTRGVKKRLPKKLKTKVIVDKIRDQLREHLRTTTTSGGLSDDVTVCDDSMSECSNFSLPPSRIASPTPSESSEDSGIQDNEEEDLDLDQLDTSTTKQIGKKAGGHHQQQQEQQQRRKRKSKSGNNVIGKETLGRRKLAKSTRFNALNVSSFLDMTFWRKEKICCGVIFKGPNDEVLICPKLLRPCPCRKNSSSSSTLSSTTVPTMGKTSTTMMMMNKKSEKSILGSERVSTTGAAASSNNNRLQIISKAIMVNNKDIATSVRSNGTVRRFASHQKPSNLLMAAASAAGVVGSSSSHSN